MLKNGFARAFTLIELLIVIAILAILAALIFPVFSRARENARGVTCLSNMRQLGLGISLYSQDYGEAFPLNRLPDATHTMTGCTSLEFAPEDALQGSSLNWKRCIEPYVKGFQIYECPSNRYAWSAEGSGFGTAPGDETNGFYPASRRIAASYAYNGSFFNEAVPVCWYDETALRPRFLSEIASPSSLILLVESRFGFPDLGSWFIPQREPSGGSAGPFQAHNGASNWLFVDEHAKRMRLAKTCSPQMWTDQFVDMDDGCESIARMSNEYR